MKKDYLELNILHSNICTTYRMEFCEEIEEYKNDAMKLKEINLHKSHNRLEKLFKHYMSFYEKNLKDESITIFTINEIRSYNKDLIKDFFKKINYELILFPAYPDVETVKILDISSNKDDIKYQLKRFSFINGIAIPSSLLLVDKFYFYLSDEPYKFSDFSSWGNSGSRVCGGIEVMVNGVKIKVFTTQFGMDINERLKSAELIVKIFDKETTPIILTGDFNSFANLDKIDNKAKEQIEIIEKVFKRVPIKKGTFIGIRAVEKEMYCADINNGENINCLDHIFLKGEEIEIIDYNTVDLANKQELLYPYSDHLMIWCKLKIK